VLGAIAIVPSAPVLVPELAGAAAELADLRAAVTAAAAALPPRWVAVGGGGADAVFGPDSAGSFAGFGVEVAVRLSPHAGEPVDLPLCALIAGWVRGQAQPDARAEVRVYGPDVDTGRTRGRQLRAEIERTPDPIGVLVVADGANTLTAAAPGGHHPFDAAVQHALDDALACGEAAALARLPGQIIGRVGFAVLAGLAEPAPRSAKELYRGAPYGVGYFAGVWQP
jgi:hypothetical protein